MTCLDSLEQDNRQLQVENAEAMKRLIENDDFKKLFQEIFIDAFAITNTYNMWSYDDQARRRFLEKTLARSHFSNFIENILEDGRQAIDSLRDEQLLEESE